MKRFLVSSGVALLVVAGEPNRIVARQVIPDPAVEMFVEPDGERLAVLVRLPIAVLADANLQCDGSGRMHRYSGRITAAFVPQPQAAGWTEIFSVPPNPALPPRK